MRRVVVTPAASRWLLLSCVIGVGISYTGWRLKDLVTATTFTLVGVINKMGTIVISALAFPGATSAGGCAALVACIVFGLAYQDAPMRQNAQGVPRGSGAKARDSACVSPNLGVGGGGGSGGGGSSSRESGGAGGADSRRGVGSV